MRLLAASLAIGVLLSGSAFAQYMISAHSGVVQSVDGRAYLEDQPIQPKFGQFPDIKENQKFRTEEGRAEILLTPGVFLRMGENSSIQMVSNKLTDTRVEVLSGSVMVECDDVQKNDSKDNVVMLLYKGNTMLLVKHGLYRVDTDPARFQVYDGEAIVKGDSGQATLRSGKETALNGVLMAENFDKKAVDDLYLWSSQRSSYLAKASASSATSLHNSLSGGGYSPWQYNSIFGMFTYVPYGGMAYSPFGWGFYSPYSVLGSPYYYGYGGYGYGGYGGGSVGRAVSFSPYSGSRWGSGSPATRGYSPGVGGVRGGGGGAFGGSGSSAAVGSGGGSIGGASTGGGGSFGGGAHMGGGGGGRAR
jgi:FecR protein